MNPQDLLLGACIYLAAAVIAAPVATRLGLGSVLGYLVAGMVIGPSLLGVLSLRHDVRLSRCLTSARRRR